jgi:hypothetical protein
MNNNKVKILKTEILSDNWYTLNKVTFEYQKKERWKPKAEKLMTAEMVQQFYFITKNQKP